MSTFWWGVLSAHAVVGIVAALMDCTAALAVLGLSALHTASVALDDHEDARSSRCLH